MISDLGIEYFTHIELDYLEEIELIDISVLAILLTLPSYNSLTHQHKYEWFHNKDNLIQNDEQISNTQLLIEKELIVIKLLLNICKQQASLTVDDLNRYLESYPISYGL
ncbi:unnamed protein product [Rotaria sp. Silwood1]|nr:unnamed protein product [Rotaria sp. Silwood1]CAF3813242.1 unnamed protein product [Rotaria sp. Silwood1]CAF4811849.1 unnamed protein product [Rotaria sp. Silwood1]CAF4940982.1 unnamed protein product [Rotaria sp. Silwood1]